jgi:hypothetical protein
MESLHLQDASLIKRLEIAKEALAMMMVSCAMLQKFPDTERSSMQQPEIMSTPKVSRMFSVNQP